MLNMIILTDVIGVQNDVELENKLRSRFQKSLQDAIYQRFCFDFENQSGVFLKA